MVQTKDVLITNLKEIIGDRTDDKTLSMLEDLTDTLDDLAIKKNDDWKVKYEQLDKDWRERYRNRFYGDSDDVETPETLFKSEEKTYTFDDLFKEEK